MPLETLEALRLLTNLETEKRKLLQVVIFGQPELDDKLNQDSIRQLKQRITFDYRLGALTRDELNYYLNHRLIVAGYQGGRMFSSLSLWLLQRKTGGIPRLVNILAHKALLAVYGKGERMVGIRDIMAACRDTGSIRASWWSDWKFVLLLWVAAAAALWTGLK
jgi:MSHA biogenesis protein MshM